MKHDLAGVVGDGLALDIELPPQIGFGAWKAGFEQFHHVAPRPWSIGGERIAFDFLEEGIDQQHFLLGMDCDHFRRVAQFPTKAVGFGKPDVTRGRERLGKRFEDAGLEEIGGPGLDVGLFGEPGGDERIGLRDRRGGLGAGDAQREKDGK